MKYGMFLAGYKGEYFLKKLVCGNKDLLPEFIVTYSENILDLAEKFDLVVFEKDKESIIDWKNIYVDKIIVAGWQYKIKDDYSKYIIFHDSYLPEYKGFCPTETALINGEGFLGATAFEPVDEIDCGDIYDQVKTLIKYPCKLHNAYNIVGNMYVELMRRITARFDAGVLEESKEPQTGVSSYSIWRDENDRRIDWTDTNENIKRFVDALGYPLKGAYTLYNGKLIYVHDVECVDMKFVKKGIGKVWSIEDNNPIIICGEGCIRLLHTTTIKNEPVKFKKLRSIMK